MTVKIIRTRPAEIPAEMKRLDDDKQGKVFWSLFFVSFFCMLAQGYQFGVAGKGNFMIFILLALIFSTVIFLILVLDNPKLSRLNQKPLFALQGQLKL